MLQWYTLGETENKDVACLSLNLQLLEAHLALDAKYLSTKAQWRVLKHVHKKCIILLLTIPQLYPSWKFETNVNLSLVAIIYNYASIKYFNFALEKFQKNQIVDRRKHYSLLMCFLCFCIFPFIAHLEQIFCIKCLK